MSFATTSMRLDSSASSSVNEALSNTACSANSLLRPRLSVTARKDAAVSFSTFSFIVPFSSPPRARTGWAAPVFVPGAIAAKSAETRMMKPAEAAWPPLGET